jgi:hypothetical protein
MERRKGESRDFSVGGGIGDGENEDNGNGKRTKKGIWTKKVGTRKEVQRGKKGEDTKRRAGFLEKKINHVGTM